MSSPRVFVTKICNNFYKRMFSDSSVGDIGAGAGKGGGGGGTIREAGGGLGRHGAFQEEEYFHRKQMKVLNDLRERETKRKLCNDPDGMKKMQEIIQDNRKRFVELNKCFKKN